MKINSLAISINRYSFLKNKVDYILFYFLVLFPVTYYSHFRKELYYFQFLLALFLAFKKSTRNIIDINYIKVLLLWIIIMILQSIYFGEISTITFIGEIMYISYAFFIVKIFRNKLPHYFSNIVYFFTLFGLVFYILSVLSSSFHDLLYDIGVAFQTDIYHTHNKSLIFYNWEPVSPNGIIRYSSIFSEPGNYACHLGLALTWNLLYYKTFFSKKNIVFFLALILTFSTAGYLTFYFITISYYFLYNKFSIRSSTFLILFLILFFWSFNSLNFMSEKMSNYFTREENINISVRGRFGATLKNLDEIKEHPIIGRGLIAQTRFKKEDISIDREAPWKDLNSWTGYLVRLGIPGFLLFIYWYSKSILLFLKNEQKDRKFFIIIFGGILISLSSQALLITPPFLTLLYLNSAHKR